MDNNEINNKLRLIEMLLLITSILFVIGKIQNNTEFLTFFALAIIYHLFISNKMHGKLVSWYILITSFSFSSIMVSAHNVMLPPSEWWQYTLVFLYFIFLTVVVFFALNYKKSNTELMKKIKKYLKYKKKKRTYWSTR